MFTCKITGTVFSGHPTRTTLGNSLRVIFYNLFMLKIANVNEEELTLCVGGDDTFIIIESEKL